MNNKISWRILVGAGLILAGLFSLLEAFDLFPNMRVGELGLALLFGAAGAVFLYVLMNDRRGNWWAVIPGMVLLGIGAMFFLEALAPRLADEIGGFIVVAFIGLAFLFVYLNNPLFWWAIIPAGVMLSAGLVDLIDGFVRFDVSWLFLLGMALTFGAVSMVRVNGRRMDWALWPAGALLILALLTGINATNLAGYFWPIVLIVGGGILVFRALRPQGA